MRKKVTVFLLYSKNKIQKNDVSFVNQNTIVKKNMEIMAKLKPEKGVYLPKMCQME